jgi:hypothetical protein
MTDAPKSQPNCAVLVLCVECGADIEVPLPMDQRSFALCLALRGWFVSVMTPPGQGPEVPILFGALCTACAQKVYSPEIFKIAEERRQQLLQAAQVASR